MYKKMILITSLFLISGCSDIGKELGATLVDSFKAGFNNKSTKETNSKKKSKEPLTKNEEIWNDCIEEEKRINSKKISWLSKKALERMADTACDTKLGRDFKYNIELEKRKHAPGREKKLNKCITKLSKLSYLKTEEARVNRMCNTLVDQDPYQQCVQEYVFIDIDKGVARDSIKRDDVRCRDLK